ncbi:MmcB family DNA repair protein [Defluviicoccus vanus]|uniref:MmcB family DNA repair protein n=1 Tax=Defluviicoccus vanus TaxID=111831 RepID=A0A7H1N675_9PROT|nr:MmcB family DNA repair protein [Defluviicoccus vanus]
MIPHEPLSAAAPRGPLGATTIIRGIFRLFTQLDYRALVEMPLANGRRADVVAVDRRGGIVLVEVKSSLADYRADSKWTTYLDYTDRFYFAVAADFPVAVLPADTGLIIADAYEAAILRPAPERQIAAPRRKAMLLAFARLAAGRLSGLVDPP